MLDFSLEDEYEGNVAGIDEAGRGPLAGPVVAACVYIPPALRQDDFVRAMNDSKKLSAAKREALYQHILMKCPYGVGLCEAADIDALNIHHATLQAMKRAYDAMALSMDMVLADGRFTPALTVSCRAVIKGDALCTSIAAASIVAKVTRDRMMRDMDEAYPHYGWARNAGYGTKAHLEAIETHGITPYHRRSFAPVKNFLAHGTTRKAA